MAHFTFLLGIASHNKKLTDADKHVWCV